MEMDFLVGFMEY